MLKDFVQEEKNTAVGPSISKLLHTQLLPRESVLVAGVLNYVLQAYACVPTPDDVRRYKEKKSKKFREDTYLTLANLT